MVSSIWSLANILGWGQSLQYIQPPREWLAALSSVLTTLGTNRSGVLVRTVSVWNVLSVLILGVFFAPARATYTLWKLTLAHTEILMCCAETASLCCLDLHCQFWSYSLYHGSGRPTASRMFPSYSFTYSSLSRASYTLTSTQCASTFEWSIGDLSSTHEGTASAVSRHNTWYFSSLSRMSAPRYRAIKPASGLQRMIIKPEVGWLYTANT